MTDYEECRKLVVGFSAKFDSHQLPIATTEEVDCQYYGSHTSYFPMAIAYLTEWPFNSQDP